jgi:hypothetical protein
MACRFEGAGARCSEGSCVRTACTDPSFDDCDGMTSNGCETDVRVSTMHCGRCGNRCALANATTNCVRSACEIAACTGTFRDCDELAINGCEVNINTNIDNCGSCGAMCTIANGTGRCEGTCRVGTCNPGFADCDGSATNGCEVNTNTSATHCGGCGMACPSGQLCVAGVCTPSSMCTAPRRMCLGVCVDVTNNRENCGACGVVCNVRSNATNNCVSSTCSLTCNPGFGNCNSVETDGCESPLNTITNCLRCGAACPAAPANATAICGGKGCGFVCNAGYVQMGAACVAIPAPRLLSPLSGSIATSRTPAFRWVNSLTMGVSVANGARIEICRDRACTMSVTTFDVTGTGGSPTTTLPTGVLFWRAFGRAGGSTGLVPSTTTYEIVIPTRNAALNTSWGVLPDFNGDAYADAVITEQGVGSVHVYNGGPAGLPRRPNQTLRSVTSSTSELFGEEVAIVGDVNGDGFVDGAVVLSSGNSLVVFHGSPTGLGRGYELTGGFGWGRHIQGAGDVNGDGYADALVAQDNDGTFAYLVLGSPMGLTVTSASSPIALPPGANLAGPTATVGKLNNDIFDDAVLVLASEVGFNLLPLYGAPGGYVLGTVVRHPDFVDSIDAAGDVNGDGYNDVIVGSADVNIARIYRGSSTGLSATAVTTLEAPGNAYGFNVNALGDINGDGLSDVGVGDGSGNVYVYFGSIEGVMTRATVTGISDGMFGAALVMAGDYNRDGFWDVLVGAPISPATPGPFGGAGGGGGGGGPCNGAVFMFSGAMTGPLPEPSLTIYTPLVESCGTRFGESIGQRPAFPRLVVTDGGGGST